MMQRNFCDKLRTELIEGWLDPKFLELEKAYLFRSGPAGTREFLDRWMSPVGRWICSDEAIELLHRYAQGDQRRLLGLATALMEIYAKRHCQPIDEVIDWTRFELSEIQRLVGVMTEFDELENPSVKPGLSEKEAPAELYHAVIEGREPHRVLCEADQYVLVDLMRQDSKSEEIKYQQFVQGESVIPSPRGRASTPPSLWRHWFLETKQEILHQAVEEARKPLK